MKILNSRGRPSGATRSGTTRWLIALLCVLPIELAAQDAAPPSAGTSSAEQPQQNNSRGSARHLDEAARLLAALSDASLKGDSKERVTDLRKDFAQLVNAYKANPDPFLPPIAGSEVDSKGDEKTDTSNWKEAFTEVENDLANILGGGATLPAPAPTNASSRVRSPAPATTGTSVEPAPANTAVGTSGSVQAPDATPNTPEPVVNTTPRDPGAPAAPANATSPAPVPTQTAPAGTVDSGLIAGAIGIKNLDPEVRRQLEQVRLNVELFFAATTLNIEGESAR